MKVYIGPHVYKIGPYQVADWLQKVGVSEDRCFKIGEWLDGTWVAPALQRLQKNRKQKISVRIDDEDVWGLDSTLALIAYPMLKLLKVKKHGASFTDDEDVPEHLRSTSAPPLENTWDTDDNFFKRWDYILDEMIWSFEQKCDNDNDAQFFVHPPEDEVKHLDINDQISRIQMDKEGLKAHHDRMQNGFRLFGKYYQNLWD